MSDLTLFGRKAIALKIIEHIILGIIIYIYYIMLFVFSVCGWSID